MRKLTALADWLGDGKVGPLDAAVAIAALYALLQAVSQAAIVCWLGAGVGIDDAEQLIYLPYLQAGYGGSQPPIYTWINWAAAQAFGTNVFTLRLVKYLVFFAGLAAVHATMRSLGYSRTTAAAALFGMMTLPQWVWESQRALSHSVAAICFASLALLSLARLARRQSPANYATLGISAAAAILAKYNNAIALGGMLAAAFSIRKLRQPILKPGLLISLAAALLALAPTLVWSLAHVDRLLARTGKFSIGTDELSFLSTALAGIAKLIDASFEFSIITVIVFGVALAIAKVRPPELRHAASLGDSLLWRTLAFGLVITAILVVASGATNVRDRWMLPVLFLLPAALAAWIEPLGERGRKAQGVVILAGLLAAVLTMPALWYVQAYGGSGLGRTVRLDYPALYSEMKAVEPVRTIVSQESWIGNFRLVDQDLHLLTEEVPAFATLLQEPAVLIWLDDACPPSEVLDPLVAAGYSLDGPIHTVEAKERRGGTRTVSFIALEQSDPATAGAAQAPLCAE